VFEKLKISSDDSDITEEFIASLIDTKRALLLKQRFSKNGWSIPNEVKQEVCMDLEVAASIDGMTCLGKILRTKLQVPNAIKIKGKEGPLNVRLYDRKDIALNIVPIEKLPFVGYNGFVSNMIYCALDYDGKLYLTSARSQHLFLEAIKITHVFESPEAVFPLECNDLTDVNDVWDIDYPIEISMVDEIVQMIVKELVVTLQIPEDNVNDADDRRG
jgi:hypothetical protein